MYLIDADETDHSKVNMTESNGSEARARLIEAMNAVVAEKGYTTTTIADVVAKAKVSRRTFYEHFDDKEECLLACHTMLGDVMLRAVTTADFDRSSTQALISGATRALMAALTAKPDLTYTHFVAMYAAGPRARQARRDVQARLAAAVQRAAKQAQVGDDRVHVPSDPMAAALVGGIGELIVASVERNRVDKLDDLIPTVVDFVSAVLIRGS
ncbi:TetR/AcrR family transcriptional regulator [Antrihabitans sp. YC2-6]|uniref:TetR/AcrR family transcriptional regulator n=1 Tax=Antrihabitans sp. YC2-6 TaxID=2799498 RepID=UPI0018F5FF68|nr:TetR/AcrR family transcriptional regulator [Antrihabitans sp. YC2-6]MBJ8345238.1 TetR/AcrR family transcriptional regulator [Antrihabitans sp. YC2-6]